MAATDNQLALRNQRPSELSNQAQDVGGPQTTWTTADYANFKFDPAGGLTQDTSASSVSQAPVGPRPSELAGVKEADDSETDKDKDELTEDDVVGDEDLDGDGDIDSVDLELDDLVDDLDTVDLGEEEDSNEKKDDLDEEEDCGDDELKEEEDSEDKDELDEEDDNPDFLKKDKVDEADESDSEDKDELDEEDDSDEKKDELDEEEDDKPDFLKKDKEDVKESKSLKIKLNFTEGNKLFESNTNLTVEDKRQSKALFESAVRSVAKDIASQLREAYQTRFDKAKKLNEAKTAKKIDQYLSYVVEQWVADNKVPLRSQLRSKLTENFMTGLKTLFTENYVEIPAGKVDVVKALAQNVKNLKSQLKLAESKNVELHSTVKKATVNSQKALVNEHRLRLVTEASVVLPSSERGKFAERAKTLTFKDSKTFRKDLIALREQYVAADSKGSERPLAVPDATPLFEQKEERATTDVDRYASIASRFLKS